MVLTSCDCKCVVLTSCDCKCVVLTSCDCKCVVLTSCDCKCVVLTSCDCKCVVLTSCDCKCVVLTDSDLGFRPDYNGQAQPQFDGTLGSAVSARTTGNVCRRSAINKQYDDDEMITTD